MFSDCSALTFCTLFTVKHTRFFLCVYEITYKLYETREALQLKKLYPLYFNTITGMVQMLFQIFFQKRISFQFQKLSRLNQKRKTLKKNNLTC